MRSRRQPLPEVRAPARSRVGEQCVARRKRKERSSSSVCAAVCGAYETQGVVVEQCVVSQCHLARVKKAVWYVRKEWSSSSAAVWHVAAVTKWSSSGVRGGGTQVDLNASRSDIASFRKAACRFTTRRPTVPRAGARSLARPHTGARSLARPFPLLPPPSPQAKHVGPCRLWCPPPGARPAAEV